MEDLERKQRTIGPFVLAFVLEWAEEMEMYSETPGERPEGERTGRVEAAAREVKSHDLALNTEPGAQCLPSIALPEAAALSQETCG